MAGGATSTRGSSGKKAKRPRRARRPDVRAALVELDAAASLARSAAERLAVEATGNGLARGEVLRLLAVAPLTVPAVARRMRQTRQSTQRLVDVLEGDGLVQRLRNPDHRVSALFTPTPAGLRLLARQDESAEPLHRRLAHAMTEADVAALSAALATVIAILDADVAASGEGR